MQRMPDIDCSAPAAPRWHLRLLGGFELDDGRQRLSRLASRAVAALLARLALAPGRAHAREELIELLWPGVELDVGRNRLRQALSTLKSTLEPAGDAHSAVLLADRMTVRIVPGAMSCDVLAFETAVRSGHAPRARQLYRGDLLPGFYDEWIDDERQRLLALMDRLGDPPFAGPCDELAGKAASRPAAPAPLSPVVSAVPHYLTRLLGAEAQVAQLRAEVLAHRLVTLRGPGGAGKTRLAVEVAHGLVFAVAPIGAPASQASPPFDLIVFVPLVTCRTPADALDRLLMALRQDGGPEDSLARAVATLSGRRALLVLDNFEQLVDIDAGWVAALVEQLPLLHLLVTSRRALGLDGEREFAIAALALPDVQAGYDLDSAATNPAVALFVDRARAVRADFHLNERNIAAIVELVCLLEGAPLAIELAAARVRAMAPARMLALLQPHLATAQWPPLQASSATPQLDLLARSGPRAGHDRRHASMQSVIEWSAALLAPLQARVLSALTVFSGSCSAEAAMALCGAAAAGDMAADGDPALVLADLVSHSLVQTVDAADGALRYRLAEPVREWAASRLAAADAAIYRWRLRAWLIAWAETMPPTAPLGEVRIEMPNLVAAMASGVADGAAADTLRLMLALEPALAELSLPDSGLLACGAAVECVEDAALRCRAHSLLAWLAFEAGQGDRAQRHAQAAQADARDRAGRMLARLVAARLQWRLRRDARGLAARLDRLAALAESVGDVDSHAQALMLRGAVLDENDLQFTRAATFYARALSLWQATGNLHAINTGRYALARTAVYEHRFADVAPALGPVLKDARAQQDWHLLAAALDAQGHAFMDARRWSEAAQSLRECVRVAWNATERYPLIYGLWHLPRALAHLRQPQAAAQLMAFAVNFWQVNFGDLSAQDQRYLRGVRRLVAAQIGAAPAAGAWQAGERLGLAEAVRLALG